MGTRDVRTQSDRAQFARAMFVRARDVRIQSDRAQPARAQFCAYARSCLVCPCRAPFSGPARPCRAQPAHAQSVPSPARAQH